jgi:hypothetical protein
MGKDITAACDLAIPIVSSAGLLAPVVQDTEELAERPATARARRGQHGMVSAEWAVGIVAAVAIAGVLLAVITDGQVQDALLKFILWVIKSFVDVVS